MKIVRRSKKIQSSFDLLQYTARYWAELIEEIESEGYKVDSADKHRPAQWITAYKDGNEYEIEVTRYSDGTYEIVKADIVGEIKASCISKKRAVRAADEDDSEWIKLNRKYVLDSDGFYTDYTLYTNGDEYICMFGDEDVYGPDPDYADFSTDSEEEALEWFDSYGLDEDIQAATDDELEHPDQEYDSAATSINSNKLPAIYKLVNFEPGKVYLDFGGGKFDNGVYYVRDLGATLLVYDPYNRSDEHNKEVLRVIRENGGADATLNSNVLNVIKEPGARLGVLKNIKKLTKSGGDIYITVYEGTGKGNEGPTKAGYQLNRKTQGYMDEVRQIFPDAQRKGKLIHAVNSSTQPITITSGTVTDKVYWYFTRHGVQPGSIPKSIDTLYDVIDTPEGTYFATNTILNTKELSQYEIKEKWLPEKYKDQTDYFEHNRVVSASDCRVVSDDEKSWGTGPYYDQSYDDDFDDYDHDYEPSQDDWNELYDVSSSAQPDDTIIDAEDLRGLSREQIEQILDEAPVGAEVIHIRNLENRFNMDELIRKKQAYRSNYFNPVGAPGDFNNLDTYWARDGYEDPYIDSTIYKAVNGTDKYYGLTSEVLKAHGITSSVHLGDEVEWNNQKYIVIDDEEGLRLRPVDRFSEDDFDDTEAGDPSEDVYLEDFQIEGASYGGAYDILDEYYFTRDDLVDFGEEVVAQLENLEPGDYFVNDMDMLNPKTIHIEVYCRNKETYADKNIAIDMRRIHKPSDLNKYAYQVALDMYDEFSEYGDVYGTSDTDSDEYKILMKSYRYFKKFKNRDSGEYKDFVKELDHKGVSHDEYVDHTDNGCVVFYDEPKTPIVSTTPSFDYGQCQMTPVESAQDDQYVPYDDIANYVHDHYSFEDIDDKYSCIDSLRESFKGEGRIAKDVIEQFVGSHSGTDAITSANDVGYSSFQDPRLQPPDRAEPEEIIEDDEVIEFSFDEIIQVDQDGSWTYEDQTYAFAANPADPDGNWYTEQDDILFRDVTGVVEDLDSIMEPNIPMAPGTYRISGDAELHYTVDGVFVYRKYYDENDFDQMIDTDDINVELKRNESYIRNFQIHKV